MKQRAVVTLIVVSILVIIYPLEVAIAASIRAASSSISSPSIRRGDGSRSDNKPLKVYAASGRGEHKGTGLEHALDARKLQSGRNAGAGKPTTGGNTPLRQDKKKNAAPSPTQPLPLLVRCVVSAVPLMVLAPILGF